MKKNIPRFVVIGLLVIVIIVVILVKNRSGRNTKSRQIISSSVLDTSKTAFLEENGKTVRLSKGVLAIVNNSQIRESYLNERYETLPEKHKQMYKNAREDFLEQLIVRELLYQEAQKMGFGKDLNSIGDVEQKKDMMLQKLIENISGNITVPEEEMRDFYKDHISDMKGASFEQVKEDVRKYIYNQEQTKIVNSTIETLKAEAEIVKNEDWIKEQQALKPENPLDTALTNGKPTIVDMGASSCIPCKMMKPIFAELEEEYKGKANILLLEISEYRGLAQKYQVMVIPTQLFFDKDGKQYWRHQGFLAKDEIVKKLQELGVK